MMKEIKMGDTNEIYIEIFVPLSSCSCVYDSYLDQVFKILNPYKNHVKFEVKNADSPEGDKYNILQNSIIINKNGNKKYSLDEFEAFLKRRFDSQKEK
jgi:hypothetical protein